MNAIDLYNKVQERTDNARTGYVKPWKNHSLIMTFEGLSDALKRANEPLPSDRIFNLVERAYKMEGIDNQTIIDVSDMFWEFFAAKMEEMKMNKHWIVKNLDLTPEMVDPNHHNRQFSSEKQARVVAEKLAAANPGNRFVVYEALAIMVTGGVSVTNL